MKDKIYLSGMATFHAARKLKYIEDRSLKNLIHGHNFKAIMKAELTDDISLGVLDKELRDLVMEFDYKDLNEYFSEPSDLFLANRVFESSIDISPLSTTISSTDFAGASNYSHNRHEIWKSFSFQASHQLPNVPDDHKCKNMHGHTFRVVLHLEASLENTEVIRIEKICAELKANLDRKCLNQVNGLENPTSEILASWIWLRLESLSIPISKVEVMENNDSGCIFNGTEHEIWKQHNIEAAVSYDLDKEIYGYGYKTKLFIKAPLDEVKGWVMDYGDVKEIFKPIFIKMDHHYLNEIRGLENPSIVEVVKWMRLQLNNNFSELSRIDLYESEGRGVELFIN